MQNNRDALMCKMSSHDLSHTHVIKTNTDQAYDVKYQMFISLYCSLYSTHVYVLVCSSVVFLFLNFVTYSFFVHVLEIACRLACISLLSP